MKPKYIAIGALAILAAWLIYDYFINSGEIIEPGTKYINRKEPLNTFSIQPVNKQW